MLIVSVWQRRLLIKWRLRIELAPQDEGIDSDRSECHPDPGVCSPDEAL